MLIGMINLNGKTFLLFAEKVGKVGDVLGQTIFRIDTIFFLIVERDKEMADGVRLEIKRKMAAIEFLFSKGFYFSFGLDLSKNYMDHKSQKAYIWNSGLMEEFLEFGFTDWNVPIIRGFWGELPLSNSQKYSLISRRVFPKVLGEN
jgi:hypothetical protein